MAIDRVLQNELLTYLSETYPKMTIMGEWIGRNPNVSPNLHYLYEHGLIDGSYSQEIGGTKTFSQAKITSAGLDFLADDGGLTAILGVVTVKLHDDTIRDLIAARIQGSDLPPEEKTGLLHQLRELRGDSIKHLTMKLLDAGAENLPKLIQIIQTSL
ncbi:hypothetical protein [Janthinobacterium sp. UMAB-56]|uniref:hypothetical protein n=1 Tax=Janthinobacterium sp. UMAB-56 TaxID=1365361 RepID=UPI001C55DDF2|nr:hypothetical protein [Janthinobacterium sp. UMAB-56]